MFKRMAGYLRPEGPQEQRLGMTNPGPHSICILENHHVLTRPPLMVVSVCFNALSPPFFQLKLTAKSEHWWVPEFGFCWSLAVS